METETPAAAAPTKIPGSVLAAERDLFGVTRADLAKQMGLHRNTLAGWEADPEVDVIRQRRYRAALQAIVDEKTPQPAEGVA